MKLVQANLLPWSSFIRFPAAGGLGEFDACLVLVIFLEDQIPAHKQSQCSPTLTALNELYLPCALAAVLQLHCLDLGGLIKRLRIVEILKKT